MVGLGRLGVVVVLGKDCAARAPSAGVASNLHVARMSLHICRRESACVRAARDE